MPITLRAELLDEMFSDHYEDNHGIVEDVNVPDASLGWLLKWAKLLDREVDEMERRKKFDDLPFPIPTPEFPPHKKLSPRPRRFPRSYKPEPKLDEVEQHLEDIISSGGDWVEEILTPLPPRPHIRHFERLFGDLPRCLGGVRDRMTAPIENPPNPPWQKYKERLPPPMTPHEIERRRRINEAIDALQAKEEAERASKRLTSIT